MTRIHNHFNFLILEIFTVNHVTSAIDTCHLNVTIHQHVTLKAECTCQYLTYSYGDFQVSDDHKMQIPVVDGRIF